MNGEYLVKFRDKENNKSANATSAVINLPNELPKLLDQFLEFVVASGYTYIGSITAHSKLTEKIWTTTEEKE